jgi:hypothetical protein
MAFTRLVFVAQAKNWVYNAVKGLKKIVLPPLFQVGTFPPFVFKVKEPL